MSEAAPFGSKESRQACWRYTLRDPIAFREYTVARTYVRGYWHRHFLSPVELGLNGGDTLLAAGRGAGKSFSVIEPELVRHSIWTPGEETILTSLRKTHVVDRMERVIAYFNLPVFARYIQNTKSTSGIVRSPIYIVRLINEHIIYGIAVGDDPDAKQAQGKHASLIIVEEAHQYPPRAFAKLDGAKDPRGCRLVLVGVPDGRMDTPYRKADRELSSFVNRRFHISRRHDPFYTQKLKQEQIEKFGGIDSDLFTQEVDAEWGSPSWSAWDLDAIYRCMRNGLKAPEWYPLKVSGKGFKERKAETRVAAALRSLPPDQDPRGLPTVLAVDVGYSEPSEGAVFRKRDGRWHLIVRFSIIERMEHDDQAEILHEIACRYRCTAIGVDASEGEGRAISAVLEAKDEWAGKVYRISFHELVVSSYVGDEQIKEQAKPVATRILRGMFASTEFTIPHDDEETPTEFNKESESRGGDGVVRVKTPEDVHIPDMFRVFAMVLFALNPPPPPPKPGRQLVIPMVGSEASLWRYAELEGVVF